MLNLQFLEIDSLCDIACFCFFSHRRAHQIGKLALMELNGNRNILRLGLELDLAFSLRVGHHECNIIEQRVFCAVRILFQVFIQCANISIKGIAFHALGDFGYN